MTLATEMTIFAAVLILGCAQTEERAPARGSQTKPNDSPAPIVTPTDPGGGQKDLRPRALIVSPMRGSSSVDTNPLVLVQVSCEDTGCATNVAATISTVASRLTFVDASNNVVTLVPDAKSATVPSSSPKMGDPGAPPPPAMEYRAGFVPKAPLLADTLYVLEARSDGEAVIGFLDQNAREGVVALAATAAAPATATIPLFTGSAPKLAAVTVPVTSGKPAQILQLRFSEPIYLADLSASKFGIDMKGGKPLAGCVLSPMSGKCVDASSGEIAEAADFAVSGVAPSEAEVMDTAFLLGESIRGSGRTVGDSANARGVAIQSSRVGAALRAQLTSADWTDCTGGGKCARDVHSP